MDRVNIYLKSEKDKLYRTRPNEVFLKTDYTGKHIYYLETPFFDNCKSLDIMIEEITFLSKNSERAYIDLENEKNNSLPKEVKLLLVQRSDNNLILTISGQDMPIQMYRCFDENNVEYKTTINNRSGDNLSVSTYELQVDNFNGNIIYFDLFYDTIITYKTPLQINIK